MHGSARIRVCEGCHGPNSAIPAVQIPNAHALPLQDASLRFEFNIVDVFDMGVGLTPTVHISVTDPTNGDAPYDLLADPEFTTCAGGASRLAVSIAWDTADYRNTGSGADPAQPISLNPLACFGNPGATPVAGQPGWFSVTAADPLPADATGTAAVTIDGHPAVTVDGNVERIPVRNVIEYVGIDGGDATARRRLCGRDRHQQTRRSGRNFDAQPWGAGSFRIADRGRYAACAQT